MTVLVLKGSGMAAIDGQVRAKIQASDWE